MPDESTTPEELRARISRLEADNEELRTRVHAPATPTPVEQEVASGRGRAWAVLSVVLIVIGCLLAPLSVITTWGRITLVDTDQFVATYAPLAHDRAVQDYVIDQTMTAIDKNVDTDRISRNLVDGLEGISDSPRTDRALGALQGPIARGLENLLKDGVTRFVRSDAFSQAWTEALKVSHDQMTGTMRNDPNAVLQAQDNGVIGIQLGPVVNKIKQDLVDRGIELAKRIPGVDKTIPVANASNIGTAQAGYRTVVALGTWLPWVSLAFLVCGVVVARRRMLALLGAALGFAFAMLVLRLGFVIGLNVLTATLPPSLAPADVTDLLFDTATDQMRDTATAGLVLGIGVAIVVWFAGPFPSTAGIRRAYASSAGNTRDLARSHGMDTGRTGEVLYAQRVPIRIVIALAVGAVIILSRPLSIGVIVVTGVVALVVLGILSVLQRPPGSPHTDVAGAPAAADLASRG